MWEYRDRLCIYTCPCICLANHGKLIDNLSLYSFVELEDAVAADEIFSILMGDAVAPRREFIERYAREVSNLDI